MRKILRVAGMIMWYGAGLFMLIFWFDAMNKWLGCFGFFLAEGHYLWLCEEHAEKYKK